MSALPPILSSLSSLSARSLARRIGGVALALVMGAGLALAGSSPAAALGTAHITGTVTAAGVGVGNLEVDLYAFVEGEWTDVNFTFTDSAGGYDFGGLEAGTYRVGFFDETQTYLDEFWNNRPTLESADNIDVDDGETVAGTNAVLARYSHIKGTVTNVDGIEVGDVVVTAYRFDVGLGTWEPRYVTSTRGDDGTYDLDGMEAGTYRVGFFDELGNQYAEEFWDDRPTLEGAVDIVVPVDASVLGKDAVLSETPPVAAVVNTAPPTITGQARVGKVLSATPGTWTPVAESTAFQWLVNEVPVAGATGTTYQPRIADVGKRISVRVTATAAGYADGTKASAQTPAVPKPAVANGTRPKISGKTVVGRKLRVSSGAWTPGSVALAYKWFANGVRVKKAKKSSFVLTGKQVGKRITVKVTASATGYTPLTVVTARTGKVKPKP